MNEVDEFHELVDRLVALNNSKRHHFKDIRLTMSASAYAKEFCTVRVDIGRRAGKSEYIKSRCNDKSAILVGNHSMKDIYSLKGKIAADIFSVHDILRGKANGCRYTKVYIDEPRYFSSREELDRVYKEIAKGDMDQTFIILGSV